MSDWDAERYHRVSNPQLEWGRRVLRRLAPQPGERVLDIGCGTGRLTAELVGALGAGTVVAVDRSDAMLREAAAKALEPHGPHRLHESDGRVRACFVRADGAALPFVDAFDAVLSTATFHWILDHDQLFVEYLPGARAGRPPRRAVRRRRQPWPIARARRPLTASPTLSPMFDGWHGPWEFADVADHHRAAGARGVHRHRRDARASAVSFPDRASFREFVSCVCLRDHLEPAARYAAPGFPRRDSPIRRKPTIRPLRSTTGA